MSQRTRTINWCEGKIIEVLSRRRTITTYLALSSLVLRNIRSLEEQHNLAIALAQLISKKQVVQSRDPDGFTIFKLAA